MTLKQLLLFPLVVFVGVSPMLANRFGLWIFIPVSLALLAIIVIEVRDFRAMRAWKKWETQKEIDAIIESGWRNVACVGGCGMVWQVRGALTYDHICGSCDRKRKAVNHG